MNRQKLFKLGISVFVLSLILTPSISFAVSNFSYNDVNLVSNANIQLLDIKSHSLQSNDNNKVKVSKDRMDAMISFAKTNPNLFLAKAIPKDKKATLSSLVKSNIEDEVTINGTFVVIAIDDFKNNKESVKYQIKSSDRTYEFYPAGNLKVNSGDTVTVKGYTLSNILVARAGDVVVKRSPRLAGATVPDSVGVQKTLVLLIKNNISENELATVDQVKEMFFNGQFSKFMTEQSEGKISFVGDVFGWDVLNDPALIHGSGESMDCSFPSNRDLTIIENKYGISLSNYDRIIFAQNNASGGCSEVGKSLHEVNGKRFTASMSVVGFSGYISNSYFTGLNKFELIGTYEALTHELGHALGLQHANGLHCKDGILNSDCSHSEYGNPYDIMGSGIFGFHFNAYYKYLLGWITPEQVIEVNSSGQYEITPQQNGSKTRLVKINIANKPQYFVEMRAPIGFDSKIGKVDVTYGLSPISNASGIFINKISDVAGMVSTSLLDMSPGMTNFENSNWWRETIMSTLNHPDLNTSMKQFTDINSGITIGPITNVNINNSNSSLSSIKFNVTISPTVCTGTAPAIENNHYNPSLQYNAGDWFSGDLFVISNDSASCGASDFTMKFIDLPEGWATGSFSPTKLSLSSGEKDSTFYDLKIPNYAYTDNYVIKIEIKSLKTGSTKIFEKPIRVNGIPRPIVAKDWIAPTQVKMGSAFNTLLNFTGGPSSVPQSISVNFYDKDNILKFSENIIPSKLTTTWNGNTSIPAYIDIPGDVPPGVYKVGVGLYSSQSKPTLAGNPYEPVVGTIEIVDDFAKINEIKNPGFIINTPSVNSSSDIPNHVTVPNHSISILPWTGPSAIPVDSSLNYIITFRGGPTQQNQRVFVHFVDQSGNIKFVSDIIPSTPTTEWKGLMRIPVSVSIPNNVSLGSYKVVAGLYSGNSSVPLVPENGVVVLGNNSNRYHIGNVSILRSASSPGLASTASVIDSAPVKKVETRAVSNTSAISTQTTQVSSTPTRGSSRSNYSSSPATPSSSPTPTSTPSPTAGPTASPEPSPSPVVESRGSNPTTTASPVTSVPSAPVAPAPAPVSEPAPAPVVSAPVPVSEPSPAPSSTPAPSPAPSPSATESI